MEIKIALAGNPNSGKTTLFNNLTGSRQRVGNWPGVTVEKKEGTLKGHNEVTIQDLPGIYSLSPYSLEEVVSRNYLVKEKPDAILNIVDGTNIERNLYLTTQLLELGIPMVVAVNMMDLVERNGDKIDISKLSQELDCPVIEISALKGKETKEAALKAVEVAKSHRVAKISQSYTKDIETVLKKIEDVIENQVNRTMLRWYAVKVFERDERIDEFIQLDTAQKSQIEPWIQSVEEKMDDDSESIITSQRYDFITKIVSHAVKKKGSKHELSISDKIDRIVTNRILALPIFVLIMYCVYTIAMGGTSISIGTMGTEWANDVLFGEIVPNFFEGILTSLHVNDVLYGLIMDGIVGGVGAVLGFVPQILVLFFLLSIMEDVGYMSRVAFIMDRIFRRFGLSGKSFIPMLVATGCGVPGIMASRTIEQDRDRKMTIMTTGFIPCGAKMPIIGLFAGAVFGGSSLVATSAFVIGIAAVVISGIMLKKFKAFAGEPAPFVMELPAYHLPSVGNVLRATWERGWSFIKRAGTIILLSSIVLWFLQGFGFTDGQFGMVEDNNTSLLASLGSAIAWIFAPLGWVGDMAWKATVATFTGLIAKEEVVNTFGVLYNFSEVSEEGNEIWTLIARDFTPIAAYSFMIFNLLCAPCFAAMGAIRREMNNKTWTVASIGYMCVFAYVSSLIVYQLGGLLLGEVSFGFWTIIALALLILILYLLFRPGYKPKSEALNINQIQAVK
ncbi:ferrous iron transport protein B [Faecalicoccus pleomorphus]|uniref:Ferrous iron transport protein B n=1 Tax=Faecalicoccus pleomorphus TaxID=1323 RepID=A0AAW6CTE4_9FIRM|nr:ferrous iron transport protein B [Faecalicoccus pleomorphus]MDB7980780.1 ferrous iron transport protein B [Faecalicoccus pleomorphus]MDB7982987.1 ferrous iron transport protein B [Faecalicoccus pleomorphus]